MRPKFENLVGASRVYSRDRSGAAIIAFGLALVPVAIMAGAAVDFGRATMLRTSLQKAADSAALVAGSRPKLTQTQRAALAQNAALANLGAKAQGANVLVTETEPSPGVYRVEINATLATTIMKVAHFDAIPITASSEARVVGASSEKPVEIALALDNTGSMRNDMPALKTAAQALVNSVMTEESGGHVRVSVVPYVAAVNPGLTDLAMVDTRAQTPWAGDWFRSGWLAYDKNCTPVWGVGGGGSGPGGSTSGDVQGDASDLRDILDPFRRIARELFGVSAAFASEVTPNTIPTLAMQTLNSSASGKSFSAPIGFNLIPASSGTAGCDWLQNPSQVSNYELFGRLRGALGAPVAWKGCVEARASATEIGVVGGAFTAGVDFDVTDAPPVIGDAASLFTPYFWPDEPDYSTTTGNHVSPGAFISGTGGFHNNYLTDFAFPAAWGWQEDRWNNGRGIMKYDRTTNAAIISEFAPTTYGPNAACPEKLTRLTNVRAQALSAIANMNYWYNGGTVISEGLMWAWRTLSPNKPFQDGAPYSNPDAKKVIVLMTDGVNGLSDNGNSSSANVSDYSAYGYLGSSRFSWANGVTTYAGLQTFLDNRLKKACDNARQSGIKIYTVLFNHNGALSAADQANSAALLQYCASKPENAFVATNATALESAFAQIAVSAAATPLRLTR